MCLWLEYHFIFSAFIFFNSNFELTEVVTKKPLFVITFKPSIFMIFTFITNFPKSMEQQGLFAAFLKIFFYSGQHNTRITTCLILPAWTDNWITWAKIFPCQMTKSSLDTELGKKQRQMLQTVKSISFVKMLLPHIISKCGSTVKSISTVLN